MRTFLLMVLVALVSSIATCSFCDIKETDVVLVDSLTSADIREAENAVRRAGIVNEINEGQPWTGSEHSYRGVGGKAMIGFTATWREPATHSGTWRSIHCRGSRIHEYRKEFRGFRKLTVYVDGGRVFAVVPSAPDEDEPPLGQSGVTWFKVYNASNGWLVYFGPPIFPILCPSGLYDG